MDAALGPGQFGMAEETGSELNRAIGDGVSEGLGIGQSVGRHLNARQPPHVDKSLAATSWRLGIPLTVHVASRFDHVCFKLYAIVDQSLRSKHADDLRRLNPSHDELALAARWTRTQDPLPGFAQVLREVLASFGVKDAIGIS